MIPQTSEYQNFLQSLREKFQGTRSLLGPRLPMGPAVDLASEGWSLPGRPPLDPSPVLASDLTYNPVRPPPVPPRYQPLSSVEKVIKSLGPLPLSGGGIGAQATTTRNLLSPISPIRETPSSMKAQLATIQEAPQQESPQTAAMTQTDTEKPLGKSPEEIQAAAVQAAKEELAARDQKLGRMRAARDISESLGNIKIHAIPVIWKGLGDVSLGKDIAETQQDFVNTSAREQIANMEDTLTDAQREAFGKRIGAGTLPPGTTFSQLKNVAPAIASNVRVENAASDKTDTAMTNVANAFLKDPVLVKARNYIEDAKRAKTILEDRTDIADKSALVMAMRAAGVNRFTYAEYQQYRMPWSVAEQINEYASQLGSKGALSEERRQKLIHMLNTDIREHQRALNEARTERASTFGGLHGVSKEDILRRLGGVESSPGTGVTLVDPDGQEWQADSPAQAEEAIKKAATKNIILRRK